MKHYIFIFIAIISTAFMSKAQNQELNFSFGHTKQITTIEISNNGKLAASAGSDKTIKLWDIKTGKEIFTFSGIKSNANTLLFNSSNTRFLAGLITGEVCIFDINSKKLISTLNTDILKDVKSLDISANDKKIIAGYEGSIIIWDIDSSKISFQLNDLQKDVLSVKFIPESDNEFIYSLNELDAIKIVNINNPESISSAFENVSQIVGNIEFLDKQHILMTGKSGKTSLHSMTSKKLIKNFSDIYSTAINSIGISSDGKYLLTGSAENRVWDIDSTHVILSKEGGNSEIIDVKFSEDNKEIIFASKNGIISILDMAQMHKFRIIKTCGTANEIKSLALNENLSYIATSNNDNNVRIWNTKTLDFKILDNFEGVITNLLFSPDSTMLLITSKENSYDENTFETTEHIRLYLHNLNNDTTELIVKNESVFSGYFSENSDIIIVSKNSNIKSYDVSKKITIDNQLLSENKVLASAISKDRKQVVFANLNSLTLVDVISEQTIVTEIAEEIVSLVFSDDNKLIFAFTEYGKVIVYESKTLTLIKKFETKIQHISYVNTISNNNLIIIDDITKQRFVLNVADFNIVETNEFEKTILIENTANFLFSANQDGIIEIFDKNNQLKVSIASLSKVDWVIFSPESYFSSSEGALSMIAIINMPKTKKTVETYKKKNVLEEIIK